VTAVRERFIARCGMRGRRFQSGPSVHEVHIMPLVAVYRLSNGRVEGVFRPHPGKRIALQRLLIQHTRLLIIPKGPVAGGLPEEKVGA